MSTGSHEFVQGIVDFLRKKDAGLAPTIGIICGSGLGRIVDTMKITYKIHYSEIPNFPCSEVVGHSNNLVFGEIYGKAVVVMQGRFHMYEGYTKQQVLIPIRVMKLLGVKTLLISNAAGALNKNFKCGDIVIIKDHISLPGLSLQNVLVGPNQKEFGERFVAMSNAYSSHLRTLAKQVFKEMGMGEFVHEGVYAHVGGPSYETPAECRMLKLIGCDVVGMSTAPEVVAARHAGMEVFTLSLVTNVCVLDEESKVHANHEEVLQIAKSRTNDLAKFVEQFIKQLPK